MAASSTMPVSPQHADDDNEEATAILTDEVEALRALYGDDNITFNASCSPSSQQQQPPNQPATISIDLSSHVGEDAECTEGAEGAEGDHSSIARTAVSVTLSAQFPPTYPHVPPAVPTLAVSGWPAAECASVVDGMLQGHSALPGEVCMFEYCEALLTLLRHRLQARRHDGAAHVASNPTVGDGSACVLDDVLSQAFHGEPLTDRKSVFQALVTRIAHEDDVDAFVNAVKTGRKGASATHVMTAFRVARADGRGGFIEACDDDGEKGAGKCMLFVLQQMDVSNVLVVVCRWFGGIKLGSVRFRHIGRVVREGVDAFLEQGGG